MRINLNSLNIKKTLLLNFIEIQINYFTVNIKYFTVLIIYTNERRLSNGKNN